MSLMTTVSRVRIVPGELGVWGRWIPPEVWVYLDCGHHYWWAGKDSFAPEIGEARGCDNSHDGTTNHQQGASI